MRGVLAWQRNQRFIECVLLVDNSGERATLSAVRKVFASILAVVAVLGIGSGALEFAHLTLDHSDSAACAGTSCHHGGGDGHDAEHGRENRLGDAATVQSTDEPIEPHRDGPTPATCLLCSVLATHTLGEWPFEDALTALGPLPRAVVLTDETALTTRWAEVPSPPRGPPNLS